MLELLLLSPFIWMCHGHNESYVTHCLYAQSYTQKLMSE